MTILVLAGSKGCNLTGSGEPARFEGNLPDMTIVIQNLPVIGGTCQMYRMIRIVTYQPFNLLHFEGGRKVVLQTRIYFSGWRPPGPKQVGLYCGPTFFRLQNHFSATLKITSKGAD